MMTAGEKAGTSFVLDFNKETRIGRGVECDIALDDPLCSRVHAILFFKDDAWHLRDDGSRNGCYVNDQKMEKAALMDGDYLRLGGTEFEFLIADVPITIDAGTYGQVAQKIVKKRSVDPNDTGGFLVAALHDSKQAQDLLLLYQLTIKLLRCADPGQVVQVSLDLLQKRVKAKMVGFFWLNDEGQLKPKIVLPENAADQVTLSSSLTELVCTDRHAIWMANQQADKSSESPQDQSDSLCVPLVHDGSALGAIHIYRTSGRFAQSDFDFAVSLANILGMALVRSRKQLRLSIDYEQLLAKSFEHEELVGKSPPMMELNSKIAEDSKASRCILICGERGTGKELVARAIHRAGSRADRPMLTVNCASISGDSLESRLFGYAAGSSTGKDGDHLGYFQQADLGTLFLDEISKLTLKGQAELLSILEGHPFLPGGDMQEVCVDVRIIAATDQNLDVCVKENKFREDLYRHLSVFEVRVPPLRKRGDDVGLLADFFLDHFRRQHGRPELRLSEAARNKLLSYHWPGNVRQLRNVLDSAVLLANGEEIATADLALRTDIGDEKEMEALDISTWERKLITEAVHRAPNIGEAAKLLGIGRATLYRKLEEYNIPR